MVETLEIPNISAWRDKLGIGDVLDSPPEGYYSAQTLSEQLGLSYTSVRIRMREAVKSGTVDAVNVRVGRNVTKYYKLKEA